MTIELNGVALPGKDHRVVATGQIERKDLSGTSSSTAAGHGGWKAWVLQVSLVIPMQDTHDLVNLGAWFRGEEIAAGDEFALEALQRFDPDGTGRPALYEIIDETANSLGVFKVRFADNINISPHARERKWEARFSLIEERSVPEKRGQRRNPSAAQATVAPANTTTTVAAAPAAASTPDGWVENLLVKANDLAGDYFFGDGT